MIFFTPGPSDAQTTMDPSLNKGWSANVGWTHWLPGTGAGATIGEYVCSGAIYGANIGWINLGSGSPANGVQYQNNSATDWGVNFAGGAAPGMGRLRGMAYAANIGWISFENVGNPSVNLLNGQLSGYAYSANCGWLNLGSSTVYAVKTDSLAPGADSDQDGLADAFELANFGNLTAAGAATDSDGDGLSDLQEYLAGTDPRAVTAPLRITAFARAGATFSLAFNSTPARLYRIETTPSLAAPAWADAGPGVFAPDGGTSTTRLLNAGPGGAAFYRVTALRFNP